MDIFNLSAKIKLDTSEFTSGIKTAGEKLKSFGSKIGSAVGTVAKISAGALSAGAVAIGGVVKKSVDAYGEYQQLVGGMQTLFKESSDEMIENAQNAYRTAGMSANEYMQTATQFSASLLKSLDGDTAKAAKYADKAIRQMSDNVNKMGTSVEMVQNAYRGFSRGNFTMLDNLSLGYAGTKEGMQELLTKAEELSAAQGEYRDFSIESYADIVDAIGLVQDEMGITGTTAKEASETVTGSLASVRGAWQNLLTGLGDPDADVKSLMTTLVTEASTAAGNIAPIVGQALEGITTVITEKGPDLIGALPGVIKQAIPVVTSTATSLITAFTDQLPDIVSSIGEIAPDVLGAVGEVFGGIITAIPASMNSITELLTGDNGELLNMVTQAGDFLVEQIPTIVNSGLDLFSALLNDDNLTGIIDNLGYQIPKLITGIIGNAEEGTGIAGHIPDIIQGGLNLMSHLLDHVDDILKALADGITQLVLGIAEGIADPANWLKAADVLGKAGGKIVEGIVDGINSAGNLITETINKFTDPPQPGDDDPLSNAFWWWHDLFNPGGEVTYERPAHGYNGNVYYEWNDDTQSYHSGRKRVESGDNYTINNYGVSPDEITDVIKRDLGKGGDFSR